MGSMAVILFSLWVTGLSPNYHEAKAIEAVQQIYNVANAKDELAKYDNGASPPPFLSKSGMTKIDFYVAARKLDNAGILFEVMPVPEPSADGQPLAPPLEPPIYKTTDVSVNLTPEERQQFVLLQMAIGNFDYKDSLITNFEVLADAKNLFLQIHELRIVQADENYLAALENRIKLKYPGFEGKIKEAIGGKSRKALKKKVAGAVAMSRLNKQGKMQVKQILGDHSLSAAEE